MRFRRHMDPWSHMLVPAAAGYVMLLWFWGSNRKRQIFKDTRKQLAQFVKVPDGCLVLAATPTRHHPMVVQAGAMRLIIW